MKGQIFNDIFGRTVIGTYTLNDDATINFTISTENHKCECTNFTPNAFLAFLDYFGYFRSYVMEEA